VNRLVFLYLSFDDWEMPFGSMSMRGAAPSGQVAGILAADADASDDSGSGGWMVETHAAKSMAGYPSRVRITTGKTLRKSCLLANGLGNDSSSFKRSNGSAIIAPVFLCCVNSDPNA